MISTRAAQGTPRPSETRPAHSGRTRSKAAAKIIRVDDRNSVPVQPSHHAPKANTMIAWMMWLSIRYEASRPGKPQIAMTGGSSGV
jgi:hypothetical protein